MTNTERAWYQDGWIVSSIVFILVTIVIPLGLQIQERRAYERLPTVIPQVTGRVENQMFGHPQFIITVWHQNSGDLVTGAVLVLLNHEYDEHKKDDYSRLHSFEIWKPNKENALKFTFTLKDDEITQEIPISFLLDAKNMKRHFSVHTWTIDDWESNQKE